MAAAGGHWLKIAQGDVGKLTFVPKGRSAAEAITGRRPEKSAFPASLSEVQKVKGLGGSTGAALVQDNAGNLYVEKKGNSAGHLREEGAADDAYKVLGQDVPEHQIYETGNGPVKLARFVDGQTLAQAQANSPTKADQAEATLRKGFVSDAVLGNWDVVGLEADNVLIGRDGKVYRIDNGGSLRYRAQGGLKKTFDQYPDDLFSMRNHSVNSQAAKIFDKLTGKDIVGQIGSVTSKRRSLLKALPKELHPVMSARLARLNQYATIHKTLSVKGYTDKVIDTFTSKLWAGLRSGSGKIDPQTPEQVIKAFSELGG